MLIVINKNILIFSISALSLLSCKNDDDTHETEIKKYPEAIVLTKDGESITTKISYNEKMQIIGYSDPNSYIAFTYQNDRVAEVRENNSSVPYTLQYTNGGLVRLDALLRSVSCNLQQSADELFGRKSPEFQTSRERHRLCQQ